MIKALNILLLMNTCILATTLPQYRLDYEVFYLNGLGLSYLAFYIFFVSKDSLFDLVATAYLLLFGLALDTFLSNYGFYFYGLVDYPYFTTPPAWLAVLWLVFPLQVYNLNIKYKFAPAAFVHVLAIVLLERQDLIFIAQPREQNMVFTFVMWFVLYRILFNILDIIKAKFFVSQ
jgi:hypothetical protein